jgi:tetratricopeptide (TPR) repeat protein
VPNSKYHPSVTPFARRLAGIFVLALAVRSLHTAAIGNAPFSRLLVGDGKGYDRWAASIAAGDWIGKETFYQAPLYPYALAALYVTAGRDPMTTRWLQAVLGALACTLLALAGRSWLSERAGLTAGAVLALYPPAIFFDGLVQKASLDNLLMCALLAVLGGYVASGRAALLPVAGCVLGLFALTRENALVFLVILAAWLPFHLAGKSLKERAAAIGLVAAGVMLVLVPVGLRNQAVGGDFLITTSQAGPNFFIGNHEGATGRYLPLRPDHETYEFERADAVSVAEKAAGRALSPGEVSSYWWSRSFDWISAHPGDWIALLGKKVMVTWNRAELPDSESLEVHADYSPVFNALAAVFGFGVLVALAAPGMAISWRRSPRPTLLYLMLFGFSAAVAAFYVFARYRFPMVPILSLFAGQTLGAAIEAVRAGRWPKPQPLVLVAAVVGIAVACIPPIVPAIGSRRLAYVNLGIASAEAGDFDAAATFYRKAIALAPRVAAPHRELAAALVALGRSDDAATELQLASRLDPRYAAAHDDLGTLLSKRGDLAGAEREFREAYRIDPSRSNTPANLGGVALARGRAEEAVSWYRKAIELTPGQPTYHYQLAVALLNLDHIAEAGSELETTLRLEPSFAAAHDDLGVLLARRGDLAGAERHFREAYRVDPERPSTLVNLGGVAVGQGRVEEAVGWYRKAIALQPDFPHARINLVQALERLGRRDEALSEARELLRSEPTNKDAAEAVARLH